MLGLLFTIVLENFEMRRIALGLVGSLVLILPVTSFATDWPTAKPEEVGMSSEKLAKISPMMRQLVEEENAPCGVVMVARKGKVVFFDKCGYQDVENAKPVQDDTIFRMYSMTKPVTGVAVMILYEEGKFQLDDPISKYLREFSHMEVLNEKTGKRVDAQPITVKHLLTHTSGLIYGSPDSPNPVGRMYGDAGIGPNCCVSDAESLDEWTKKLAKIPLIAQPGTQWNYGVSMDVLARLVEVWSGKSFDTFLRERIFEPLDMRDTGFHVPTEKHDRLSVLYDKNEDGDVVIDHLENRAFLSPAKFPMGGTGLVSTPRDYFRFLQMLVDRGEFNGVRILAPKTVELMTRDHLPKSMGANPFAEEPETESNPLDRKHGFGFTVRVYMNPEQGKTTYYTWGGHAGTSFFILPQEEMSYLFFTQTKAQTSMKPEQRIGRRLGSLALGAFN